MRKTNPFDASAVRPSTKRRTTGRDLLRVDTERRQSSRPEKQGLGAVERITYEIDPHQRLVATAGGLRQVLDGTFKISKDNELVYHVKRPMVQDEPQQVRCSGAWTLDAEHRLVLSLDKWSRHIAGGKLVLKAEVLSASGHELVFTLDSRDSDGREKITLLTFSGSLILPTLQVPLDQISQLRVVELTPLQFIPKQIAAVLQEARLQHSCFQLL